MDIGAVAVVAGVIAICAAWKKLHPASAEWAYLILASLVALLLAYFFLREYTNNFDLRTIGLWTVALLALFGVSAVAVGWEHYHPASYEIAGVVLKVLFALLAVAITAGGFYLAFFK